MKFWNELKARYLDAARDALGPEEAQRVESEGGALALKDACSIAYRLLEQRNAGAE